MTPARLPPVALSSMLHPMDKTTLTALRELAEQNGIDPEQLLAIGEADGLDPELRRAVADILGDVTLFGQALDGLGHD